MKKSCCKNAIRFTITGNQTSTVDHRLFGQFLEKASFGEPGPEAAVDKSTGRLRPEVGQIIKDMQIPVIRFPGGTDIDFSDWRDMVDNIPGRSIKRPEVSRTNKGTITNYFGYDEFLRFAEEINTEVILVVNLRDAIAKVRPLREAALLAAGLAAYCNAPVGTTLPDGMPDWPSVRAKNGRHKPYNVRYFQIGNEAWIFIKEALEQAGISQVEHQAKWYLECMNLYIDMIKSVSPGVEIIADGNIGELTGLVLSDDEFAGKVDYITYHSYMPVGINEVYKDGVEINRDNLTEEDVWYTWVAVPSFDREGRSAFLGGFMQEIDRHTKSGRQWKYAMTEWNWNGWMSKNKEMPLDNSLLAKGIGAAGYLHAIMRAGSFFTIANQSNLIGSGWPIGAVRADPEAKVQPYMHPTGQVTSLYGRYHGSTLLELIEENVPSYRQPFEMGPADMSIKPAEKVMVIDALATEAPDALYFHAIIRSFTDSYDIIIDISKYGDVKGKIIHHILEGRLNNTPLEGQPLQVANITDREPVFADHEIIIVRLPKRSVSVVEIMKNYK